MHAANDNSRPVTVTAHVALHSRFAAWWEAHGLAVLVATPAIWCLVGLLFACDARADIRADQQISKQYVQRAWLKERCNTGDGPSADVLALMLKMPSSLWADAESRRLSEFEKAHGADMLCQALKKANGH